MNPSSLKKARLDRGLTQREAARRLGVTQAYLSMLERGRRSAAPLARKLLHVYRLQPTMLPPARHPKSMTLEAMARELAALGYPGFSHRARRAPERNPAELLLALLERDLLEARLVEALPWLLLRYWDADWNWLVEQSKLRDLQNRLGFVVSLARRLSESAVSPDSRRTAALAELESRLEKSRLAREDTLGRPPGSPAEHNWVAASRSSEAEHWNLLTDWRPEHFRYAS